jgi:predicted small integral membrane protein
MLGWMGWTWQTALFFGGIASALLLMTGLAIWRPETPRAGMLGLITTRGDRLFLSLLGAAFIHLAWLGFLGEPLWPASIASLALAGVLFRWA